MRVWERMRRPEMLCWMRSQEREYHWSNVGGTAETAVWQQLVHAESLDLKDDGADSEAMATVLLDLVKCFEKVRLEHVWNWGCY